MQLVASVVSSPSFTWMLRSISAQFEPELCLTRIHAVPSVRTLLRAPLLCSLFHLLFLLFMLTSIYLLWIHPVTCSINVSAETVITAGNTDSDSAPSHLNQTQYFQQVSQRLTWPLGVCFLLDKITPDDIQTLFLSLSGSYVKSTLNF